VGNAEVGEVRDLMFKLKEEGIKEKQFNNINCAFQVNFKNKYISKEIQCIPTAKSVISFCKYYVAYVS
jgi:hypothetical protein